MIVPWILPTSIEKLLLAKAFCSMPMQISPGAIKSAKGAPMTLRSARPMATVNITRNNKVVIDGAQTVCSWTLKNRLTSFQYSARNPAQLTPRMTGTPGAVKGMAAAGRPPG